SFNSAKVRFIQQSRWLAEYNSERPHESLNNLTPEEYRLMAAPPEISKSAWN
uniref:integrase core domain-containing protein n=1 Tax=Klebsiella michiganensis TaxID=1134687 RepID=UPI0037DC9509